MTATAGIVFLLVGLLIGAAAAWLVTRAEVRVAREELAAERAERRSDATGGIKQIADELGSRLHAVATSIAELDKQRAAGDASLRTTLATLQESDRELRAALLATATETARLTTALRDNRVRGRWGELSLRRIVELSGMVEHCDFSEQPTTDPAEVTRLLEANAAALRAKVREIARRDYAAANEARFAILYVPMESVLSAALSVDPKILEDALAEGVHITSPVT